jgi:PAS domain-containing protein
MVNSFPEIDASGGSRRRTAIREVLVAAFFLLAAVVMTWPLTPNISRAVSEPGDPFFTAWVLDWNYQATIHRHALFDANIFVPARHALAFSEHMYGIALVLFPLFAMGIAPLTIHNIALLLGFAACGYAMYILCRWTTRSSLAAVPAGILYAFLGFRFHHLPHLHFVWSMWLPVLLLALLVFVRHPTPWRAIGLCAAFVMNGITTLHWFAFGSFAIACTAIFLAFATGKSSSARFWLLLFAAFTLGLAALSPFLLPYKAVTKEYGMHRYYIEALEFSAAEWRDWLQPGYRSKVYGRLSPAGAFSHERTLFPGFVAYALAALGLLFYRRTDFAPPNADPAPAGRRYLWILDLVCLICLLAAAAGAMFGSVDVGAFRYTGVVTPVICLLVVLVTRCWLQWPFGLTGSLRTTVQVALPLAIWVALLWIIIGVFGARGLNGVLDTFLFDHLSVFRSIRVPVRWVMIAYVGLSMLVAAGMAYLLCRLPRTLGVAVTLLVSVLLLLELRVAPLRWYLVPLEQRPTYEWLRTAPFRGAVVEFPMTQQAAYDYLWRSTVHHRPLINGVSSYIPNEYEKLVALYQRAPMPDELFTALEGRGCSVIVVHDGWIQDRSEIVRDWLRRGVAAGRLTFVRRFDAGARADYVFALTRSEPAANAWRAPETADPAGFTPMQNAQRFLDEDAWNYCAQPFGNIDSGPPGRVHGDLDVAGWATSPLGIDHVEVRLANGRVRQRADLFDRGDVTGVLPWHPPVKGFRLHFAAPPRQAVGDTDLQFVIVDKGGRSRWMPPFWFRWSPSRVLGLRWHRLPLEALLVRLDQDPAKIAPMIISGRASIRDYVDPLITDAMVETDIVFVNRAVERLLDETPTPASTHPYLRLITRGTSRERVLEAILRSPAFANKYLATGSID